MSIESVLTSAIFNLMKLFLQQNLTRPDLNNKKQKQQQQHQQNPGRVDNTENIYSLHGIKSDWLGDTAVDKTFPFFGYWTELILQKFPFKNFVHKMLLMNFKGNTYKKWPVFCHNKCFHALFSTNVALDQGTVSPKAQKTSPQL